MADLLPRNRVLPNTTSQRGDTSQVLLVCVRLRQWMTVDDSLFLGTWTDKQSSIPYHDVCDAGLDFVGFFSLRSDMSAIWLW
ncbi:hypothetical protein TNCV_4282131 [Trichonephila clavipes]|nr:hypothetical protein TNCV_4282131 [Trichonephila clavipes]